MFVTVCVLAAKNLYAYNLQWFSIFKKNGYKVLYYWRLSFHLLTGKNSSTWGKGVRVLIRLDTSSEWSMTARAAGKSFNPHLYGICRGIYPHSDPNVLIFQIQFLWDTISQHFPSFLFCWNMSLFCMRQKDFSRFNIVPCILFQGGRCEQ